MIRLEEYVRTDKYGIYKADGFFIDSDGIKYIICEQPSCEHQVPQRCIIKHSFDITDLLEPQDLMYIDIDNGCAGGIVVPRIAETLDELNKYIDRIKKKEVTLVGIVTHEQLHNMVYKVGENNDSTR